jgi:hypothetical protein
MFSNAESGWLVNRQLVHHIMAQYGIGELNAIMVARTMGNQQRESYQERRRRLDRERRERDNEYENRERKRPRNVIQEQPRGPTPESPEPMEGDQSNPGPLYRVRLKRGKLWCWDKKKKKYVICKNIKLY